MSQPERCRRDRVGELTREHHGWHVQPSPPTTDGRKSLSPPCYPYHSPEPSSWPSRQALTVVRLRRARSANKGELSSSHSAPIEAAIRLSRPRHVFQSFCCESFPLNGVRVTGMELSNYINNALDDPAKGGRGQQVSSG